MSANRKTLYILVGIGLAMLALGFASKPLYDTFCKVTGYGGTTRYADENLSEILDRKVTCLLYTSPSPRDRTRSRMPSSA